MKTRVLKFIGLGMSVALLIPMTVAEGQIRSYTVNYTSSQPTLDGVVSPGEWDTAGASEGGWTLLRTAGGGDPDNENNTFRAMWDQESLYVLYESDYGGWLSDISGQNPAPFDGGADNLNIYFDPNTLGEPNTKVDAEVNGYQVAFNQYPGAERNCGLDGVALTMDDCSIDSRAVPTDVNQNGSSFGMFTEGHVDTLFGNQAEWAGLRLSAMSQINDANGGTAEMKFAWADFDALATTAGGADSGLNKTTAPSNDDVWLFNISRISSGLGNQLPVWNWTSSNYFASHGNNTPGEGHGELTFVGKPSAIPCDFNADDLCNIDDLDPLTVESGMGTNNPDFDVNGDGAVDLADVEQWLVDAGARPENAAATSGNAFLVGDSNLDGTVDGLDFIDWNEDKFTDSKVWSGGNWNADSVTDGLDFIEWNDNKFTSSADGTAVPEPATAWLLLVGFGVAGLARRRR